MNNGKGDPPTPRRREEAEEGEKAREEEENDKLRSDVGMTTTRDDAKLGPKTERNFCRNGVFRYQRTHQ